MATDYSILEDELTNQLSDLKRDLHMRGVKSLSRKHHGLAKLIVQRKQIDQLKKQISDLEPTVTMIYSAQNALKDNEIKGYLIYLLQLKEFFAREVETKKEIIRQRDDQIKKLVVKLCAMRNEYAKKKRSLPRKAPEFTLLENMSNRMNQIEKRICSLQHENKEIRESIMDLRIFQKQYKKFEKEFREKIKNMTDEAQAHLDRAVATYEEREDFINKGNIYKERCALDLRKTEINQNALNLILEKTKKFEDFGHLQKRDRSDARIATTGDLIEQGITGLEPALTKVQNLHSAIVHASGKETPEQMEDHFKLTDDQANSKFSYLEELLKGIHHTQDTIDELRAKNKNLLMGLSTQERRLRWEIKESELKKEELSSEAEAAVESKEDARAELDGLLEKVHSLYLKCRSWETKTKPDSPTEEEDDTAESSTDKLVETMSIQPLEIEEQAIDDSNIMELNENIEKKILEYLMLIEYIRMKETVHEDLPSPLIGADDDEPVIEEPPEIEYLDTIHPRILRSETELQCISDLHREGEVLPLDQLKSKAVAAVAEIESCESTEDEDSAPSKKGKKRA